MSYITSNSKIVTHNSKWITTDYVPPTPPQILDMPLAYNSSGGNPAGTYVYDWHQNVGLVGCMWVADVPAQEKTQSIHVTKISLPYSQSYELPSTSMSSYKRYWRKQNEYPYQPNDTPGDNTLEVYIGLFKISVRAMTSSPYGWRGQDSTTSNTIRLLWSLPLGKRIRDFWDNPAVPFYGGTYSANFDITKGSQLMASLFVPGYYLYHYFNYDGQNVPQIYPYNNGEPYTSTQSLKLYYEPEA